MSQNIRQNDMMSTWDESEGLSMSTVHPEGTMTIHPIMQQPLAFSINNWKCQPAGGARGKARRSSKSSKAKRAIIRESWVRTQFGANSFSNVSFYRKKLDDGTGGQNQRGHQVQSSGDCEYLEQTLWQSIHHSEPHMSTIMEVLKEVLCVHHRHPRATFNVRTKFCNSETL